jgi:hypothetical protein
VLCSQSADTATDCCIIIIIIIIIIVIICTLEVYLGKNLIM